MRPLLTFCNKPYLCGLRRIVQQQLNLILWMLATILISIWHE
jgi:hypothetical protein